MTECERLIKGGKFSEDFFEPEYRNDFYVDGLRKKIWAIEIDLYLEFERVCQKHNLKYCAFFGTLLGCIRHNGFVPWDDDIDIAMPRSDYNKFISLAYEFKTPYFLQLPMTDEKSGFSIAKLRNSNTTAIAYPFRYQNMNHGIFIDINPIDKIDKKDVNVIYNRVKELALQNSAYMRLSNPNPEMDDIRRIKKWKGESSVDIFYKIQEICSQYAGMEKENVGLIASTIYACEKQVYLAEDFQNVVYKKFENINLPVPQGYDHILKTIYGNYMELPPLDFRNAHASILFDPDEAYCNKIKMLSL